MNRFSWIPAFQKISKWLLDYEHRQVDLLAILSEVGIDNGLTDENTSGEKFPLNEIDPFSFFSLFMKYGIDKRERLFEKLLDQIELDVDRPVDFDGVPSAQALKVWLFPYSSTRTTDMIPKLWELFKQAHNDSVDAQVFSNALSIPNCGFAKLTECLFYAFPYKYLPVDAQTKPWLKSNNIEVTTDWGSYKQCLSKVREQFEKPFPEISYDAWHENQLDKFSAQKALDYLKDRFTGTYSGTTQVAAFRSLNGKELAFEPSDNPENKRKIQLFLSDRPEQEGLFKKIGVYDEDRSRNHHLKQHAPTLALGNKAYKVTINSLNQLVDLCDWYVGSEVEEKTKGEYVVSNEISSELVAPLNQILFGPPGTGKTFSTTDIAVQIADTEWYASQKAKLEKNAFVEAVKRRYDELVDLKRVVFTTFHQSFAYEDFIEGIRASTDSQTGALRYEIQDGVFKQLCEAADVRVMLQNEDAVELTGRRIWKMSLGNTLEDEESIYQECLENNYALLGYGRDVDFSGCKTRDEIKLKFESETGEKQEDTSYVVTSVHIFKNTIKSGDLIVVSDGNHKFRAIGEFNGEYNYLSADDRVGFHQMRSVKWLRQYEPSLPKEQLFKKSLSQMTLYELRKQTIDHEKLSQLLAPNKKEEQKPKPHVIIIDEINRGNISRILGELITLLEPSKRKGADDARNVTLPYSKQSFMVPGNVYVIGTMNTADKSLAQLDLALRRRFTFVEIPPNSELLNSIEVHGVNLGEMLNIINQRIEVLLDKDHLIGHSYFLPLREDLSNTEREDMLAQLFQKNIIPLLQEYFFDDWERIGWVLNDDQKRPNDRFITHGGDNAVNSLFSNSVAEQITDRRYKVNYDAFTNPVAYRGILIP